MSKKEVRLRDYIIVIRKHDFIVIVSFLLIFGSALIISLYLPRIYEASAIIEIQPSTNVSGFSSLMQNVISRGVDQVSMETICRRFTSNTFLYEVINNLKKRPSIILSRIGSPEYLIPKIKAKNIPDTRMIEVSVRMKMDEGGSEFASIIANELIHVIQEQRSTKANEEITQRQNFINNKIKIVEDQIDDSTQKVRNFLKENGDSVVWNAYVDNILLRLSDMKKLRESSAALISAELKKINRLNVRLSDEPEFVEYSKTLSKDPLWEKYRLDLAELQKQYVAAQATTLGLKNPTVKSLKAQIDEITEKNKALAKEEISSRVQSLNPTRQTILNQLIESQLNLIAYQSQNELAEKLVNELELEKEKLFSKLPENQFQLYKMNREVDYIFDVYKNLLEKKLEAEILALENNSDNSKVKGGIEIVDIARPVSKPVSPRIKFISAIAAIAGIAVGLAMAFLSNYFEDTYQSPDEVKDDLEVPLLGVLPYVNDRKNGMPVLSPENLSYIAESFRLLAANIELFAPEKKSFLVISSLYNEGRSIIVANLAIAMSQIKNNVVIVDCDLRNPSQHEIFGLGNSFGLSNLVTEKSNIEQILLDTKLQNLKVICSGKTENNPIELLKSDKMNELMSKLKSSFDVIIADSSPLSKFADTLVLAQKFDSIIFLVDMKRTSREIARRVYEQLSVSSIPIVGIICNNLDVYDYSFYSYEST
ncbi:MAG: GumC family protein [bacterium]